MLELDLRWHDELLPISQYVAEGGTLMGKGCSDRCFQWARPPHAHAINPHRFAHACKIRIVEPRARRQKSARLHLDVDEAQESIIEDDNFDWQFPLAHGQQIAHEHPEAAIT